MDKRVKKILFDTYWTNSGWISEKIRSMSSKADFDMEKINKALAKTKNLVSRCS